MAQQGDEELPVLLVVAAGIGLYFYMYPPAPGSVLATAVQQAQTTVQGWLAQVPWGAPFASPAVAPVAIAPGAPGGPAGAPPAVAPAAVTPVAIPAAAPTSVLAPIAVTVGVAGASMSDLETAHMIESLAFSVAQNGGKVINNLNIADLGQVLQIVGTVGLVVDMVFTVLGNASDAQKAFDMAMDLILIAAIWIPVVGWAIAIVVGIIKMIGDMFGFSQGLTHAQREALERAKYGEELAPMLGDLAHAFSPREMLRVLIAWGSGSCGGTHIVAMMAQLHDGTGGVCPIVSADCYQWAQFAGTSYRGHVLPAGGVSLDQQALWMVQYGLTDFTAEAQVGIREDLKLIFNEQIVARVQAKLPFWQGILAEGGTLDSLDVIADEIRLTPDLNALATFYGWGTWQAGLAAMLQPQWTAYHTAHPTGGTLAHFAQEHGYADLRAWRAALFAPFWPAWQRWHQVLEGCAAVVDRVERPFGILTLAHELNAPPSSGGGAP